MYIIVYDYDDLNATWEIDYFTEMLQESRLDKKLLKSVHFKKTVARISFLSKLWYFQYKSNQKVPQFSLLFYRQMQCLANRVNCNHYQIIIVLKRKTD